MFDSTYGKPYEVTIGKLFFNDHWDRIGVQDYNHSETMARLEIVPETKTMVKLRLNEKAMEYLLADAEYYAFEMRAHLWADDKSLIAAAGRVVKRLALARASGPSA